MKVQCSCGTKYAFDVTPEMAQSPFQLVCQNCGTDLSDYVNNLIRQELQATQQATPAPPAPPSPPPGAPRMRIAGTSKPEAAAAPAAVEEMPICLKHPPNRTTNKCLVCQKPICPQCMKLFGYVCSPLCREKAESRGVKIPVYAGQWSQMEAREGRKTGLITLGIAAVFIGLVGLYFWYIFLGCLPRPNYSVKFAQEAASGKTVLADNSQLIYLHGSELGRFDTKKKQQVWQRDLSGGARGRAAAEDFEFEERQLKVNGRNIWVVMPGKMQSYDWDSGQPKQEVPLVGGDEAVVQKDEVLVIGNQPGNRTITHISLADGQSHTEKVVEPLVNGKAPKTSLATARAGAGTPLAGLEGKGGAPLDPNLVASQVSHLSAPARIALPVLLLNAEHQEQLMNAMSEDDGDRPRMPVGTPTAPVSTAPQESYSLIPMEEGCLQFSVRLLEKRLVAHDAMKDRPKTSALSSAKASDTRAVANEILNDMQRDRGADKVMEDESRYWVTLRRSDDQVKSEWIGEVTGPPGLVPLQTVNVLAAGNSIRVFDKANKKLWEATLTFSVALNAFDSTGGFNGLSSGEGPCVERGDTLFVADQGVLTAFDLKSGEARWRLPSVGITGIFFDEAGMIYVNTTTASLDSIKYSRQIDIGNKVDNVILKIDPRSGKTLWKAKAAGNLNYISGKFLYIVSLSGGSAGLFGGQAGLGTSAHVTIVRLNPKSGKVMWGYQEDRYPLNVQFHDNTIQLIYDKEIEGLKFYTF